MSHLSEGLLRVLADDPDEVAAAAAAHVRGCPRCQLRLGEISARAARIRRVLTPPDAAIDPELALERIRSAIGSQPPRRHGLGPAFAWRWPPGRRSRLPVLVVATVMAALVTSIMTGWARDLLVVFQQPRHVVVIPVRPTDVDGIDAIADYGRLTFSNSAKIHSVPSAEAVEAEAGFAPLSPAAIPPGASTAATYRVLPAYTAIFTFDAATARRTAAQRGRHLNPMPPDIDGASIFVDVGPVVYAAYGIANQGPGPLTTVRMPSPVLRTSGVSIARLRAYVLSQPGISPDLAASIRSIDHPGDTLPLLVLSASGTTETIQVQGRQGSLLRGSSAYGTLVTWLNDGLVDAVYGTLPPEQLVAAADSSV